MADGKNAYALVIGINEYGNRVPRLGNARQDAEAVARQLGEKPHDW